MVINLFYFSIPMKKNHKNQSIICKIHRSTMSEIATKENNHILSQQKLRLLCSHCKKNRLLLNVRKKNYKAVCVYREDHPFLHHYHHKNIYRL